MSYIKGLHTDLPGLQCQREAQNVLLTERYPVVAEDRLEENNKTVIKTRNL